MAVGQETWQSEDADGDSLSNKRVGFPSFSPYSPARGNFPLSLASLFMDIEIFLHRCRMLYDVACDPVSQRIVRTIQKLRVCKRCLSFYIPTDSRAMYCSRLCWARRKGVSYGERTAHHIYHQWEEVRGSFSGRDEGRTAHHPPKR